MIPLFGEAAIAIGGSLALSVIVKATIVSTGVLIAVRVARRAPASVRHLLLASGFAVLLALPVATLTVPEVELGVPTQPVRAVPNVGTPGTADVMSPAVSSPDDVGLSPVVPARRVLSLGMVLLIVWIIGVATVLARVIADMLWVRRVRRQARPWSRGEAIVAGISGSSSIRSRTRILLDETAAGPITCGVFRPAIVFPGEACAWDAEELRRAVIHELEHVRRADLLMFCVARIVCALYWFHPLVWVSWRRLRLEAERACDDAVLRGFEPVEYADQLVTLAERLVSRRIETVPAMADRTDLSVRISAVLDPQQRRGRAGLRLVAFVSMVAILVVAAVSSLRAVPQSSNPLDAAARARFEVASIKPTKQCAVFGGSPTPGRVSTCGALAFMIQGAYDVYTKGRGFKPGVMTVAWTANIEGAPAWLQSELYQIEAKAAGNPPQIVMNGPMMQALFEDRLKLKTHLETRNVPVYELTVVRGGPKLQRAETDCVPFDPMKPLVEPTFPGQESPKPRLCGGFAIGKGTMDFTETTISDFAQYLGRNIVRRPVIDKVGIAGRFNFHLQFAPDENTPLLSRSDAVTGPSIFTAMQEQLGLKLEPATGPHEFLVIDSVDRPSDN